MPELTLTETVAAPRDRVWRVFTDLELFEREVEAVRDLERVDGTGFHVGTRWRETRVLYGREDTQEMWVTAAEPPERYVVESESTGAHYRTEFRFAETTGVTRVSVAFSAEATSTVARLLTPLTFKAMSKNITRALAGDLAAMKAAAERDA